MPTLIANESLHALGIQSYLNDDEGYFRICDLFIGYDANGRYYIEGASEEFTTVEELIAACERISEKKFIPAAPIPPEKQWQFTQD